MKALEMYRRTASGCAGVFMLALLTFVNPVQSADGTNTDAPNSSTAGKTTPASLQLPVCFTDNMVLQRNRPVAIWGDAAPGSQIRITFAGQAVRTQAAENGKWRGSLNPMPANATPQVLRIESSLDRKTVSLKNVLIGEVWLAGGQSNMAFALRSHVDAEKYLPTAPNQSIRLLKIPVTEFGPIDRRGTKWAICDEQSARNFSAVAYFFAIELQRRLKVPVGIIGSYRGATWNENWMTPESIKTESKLKYLFDKYDQEYGKFSNEAEYEVAYQAYLVKLDEWRKKGGWSFGMVPFAPLGPKAYQRPSGLYECMIKPLQPYSIRGVIWYQGEGNSGRHEEFRTLFPAFVKGWRKTWQDPDMPFYFVQLPGYKAKSWPYFRQAQLDCSRAIPHCGMIVSEGCGDHEDIHPKVKKPIGDRLANAACVEQYHQSGPAYGPMDKSVERKGNKLIVTFDHCGSGLVAKGGTLKSFEIAGHDGTFVPAHARIEGRTIEVWADAIPEPAFVRYAWAPSPVMDLFNKEELPASPFVATVVTESQ